MVLIIATLAGLQVPIGWSGTALSDLETPYGSVLQQSFDRDFARTCFHEVSQLGRAESPGTPTCLASYRSGPKTGIEIAVKRRTTYVRIRLTATTLETAFRHL